MLPAPPKRNGNDSLLKMLVAPPHALAQPHPLALHVAPQQPLPPQARFGPTSPSQVTNSPFTGGVTANPTNMVHPQDATPNFQPPTYSPLAAAPAGSILTTLFPLVASVLGSGATARPTADQPTPPTPPATPGPYWNPATSNTPWDPGHVTNQNQATTSGEQPPIRDWRSLAIRGARRTYAV